MTIATSPRAGIAASLSLVLIGFSAVLSANAEDTPPRGSLTVDRDIVRAGTHSRLAWEVEILNNIESVVMVSANGQITPKKEVTMRVRTLGVAFQSGSTLLPIAAYWSLNDGSWQNFFFDKAPNVNPSEVLIERAIQAGETINFGARGYLNGWLPFHATGRDDNYVTVLKNGDTPPDYAPAYNQGDIVSFMRPYVDGSGKMQIGPRDLIILWECSTSKPGSPYFDMQDLVVLVTFE